MLFVKINVWDKKEIDMCDVRKFAKYKYVRNFFFDVAFYVFHDILFLIAIAKNQKKNLRSKQ